MGIRDRNTLDDKTRGFFEGFTNGAKALGSTGSTGAETLGTLGALGTVSFGTCTLITSDPFAGTARGVTSDIFPAWIADDFLIARTAFPNNFKDSAVLPSLPPLPLSAIEQAVI